MYLVNSTEVPLNATIFHDRAHAQVYEQKREDLVGSCWAAEGQEGIPELADATRRLKGEQGNRRRRRRRRGRRRRRRRREGEEGGREEEEREGEEEEEGGEEEEEEGEEEKKKRRKEEEEEEKKKKKRKKEEEEEKKKKEKKEKKKRKQKLEEEKNKEKEKEEEKKKKEKEEKKKIFRHHIEAFIPSWNDLKNFRHCRGWALNSLNIYEEPFPLPHYSGIGHLQSESSVFDNRCFLSCRFRTRSRCVVM